MALTQTSRLAYLNAMQMPSWRLRGSVHASGSVPAPTKETAPAAAVPGPTDSDLLPRLLASSLHLISPASTAPRCLLLSDRAYTADSVFSTESDRLLGKMLAAIELGLPECSRAALANEDALSADQTLASLLARQPVPAVLYLVHCDPTAATAIRQSLQPIAASRQVAGRLAVCFHPDVLLAHPALKRDAWEILKQVRATLTVG